MISTTSTPRDARSRPPSLILVSLDRMTPLKIAVFVAVLVIRLPCAFAGQSKADMTLQRMESLLDVYQKEHPLKEYPSTPKEFEQFAAKKGTPLDLSPFSEFSFKRSGRDLSIWYRRKDNGVAELRSRHSITVY